MIRSFYQFPHFLLTLCLAGILNFCELEEIQAKGIISDELFRISVLSKVVFLFYRLQKGHFLLCLSL